jgi:hypothetical protein
MAAPRALHPASSFATLLRADRCADLEEQPVRLAELALAGGFVAGKPSQLGALDVKEGLVTFCARHLEPGVGFGKRGLYLSRRLEAVGFAEGADSGELGENSQNRVPRGRETAIASSASAKVLVAIAQAEMRSRH